MKDKLFRLKARSKAAGKYRGRLFQTPGTLSGGKFNLTSKLLLGLR